MGFDIEPEQGIFYLILAGLALVTLLPIWQRWRRHRLDVFEPPVWVSLYCLMVFGLFDIPHIHGWLEVYKQLEPASFWMWQALGVVLLGIVCMWAAYALPPSRSWRPMPFCCDRALDVKLGWILVLSGIGLGLRIYMIWKGYFGYLMVRGAYFDALTESQTVGQLSVLGRFGFILAAMAYFQHPQSWQHRWLFRILLAIHVSLAFLSGMKSELLYPLLLIALIYFYIQGRFPTRHLTVAILAILLLVPINRAYRDLINSGAVDRTDIYSAGRTASGVTGQMLAEKGAGSALFEGASAISQRLALLPNVALAMQYVAETDDLWYGKNYWYFPILAFVPRFLWQDKPVIEMGYWFSYAVVGNPRNLYHSEAITLPGDLYLNFGLGGVCGGFFLLGLVFRLLYKRNVLKGDMASLFIYIALWLNLVNLENDLVTSWAEILKQFLLLVLISRFAFKKTTNEQEVGSATFPLGAGNGQMLRGLRAFPRVLRQHR